MHEALRYHTDHFVGSVVEKDLFPDDVWIAAEVLLPKRVADDENGSRTYFVVFGSEIAPHERRRAHDFEIVGSDHPSVEKFRFAGTGQVHTPATKYRHRFEDLIPRAPIDERWIGHLSILDFQS